MVSVRIGYSADWKEGVWPGCPAHCGKLARVETIWVMATDTTATVDSGGTSSCLPHQIPHSPSHRLLADRLSHQHGCRQPPGP